MSLQFFLENLLFGLLACQIISEVLAFFAYRVSTYLHLIGFTIFCYTLYVNPSEDSYWLYAFPFFYTGLITLVINSSENLKKITKIPNSAGFVSLFIGFLLLLLWKLDLSVNASILVLIMTGIFSYTPIFYFIKHKSRFLKKEKYTWLILWSILILGILLRLSYELFSLESYYSILSIILINSLVFLTITQMLSRYKYSISQLEQKNTTLFKKNLSIIKSNAQLEKKLISSQDKAFNNQINPHFIFNSINSIVSLIYAKKILAADKYLNDFSSLLRLILTEENRTFVSLKEEIEILEKYVSLEKLRKQTPFKFQVKISQELDYERIYIPRLFFQALVENSIWHGFSEVYRVTSPGIDLSITSVSDSLKVTITDNGIGINQSIKDRSNSYKFNSKGMAIIRERLKILGQHYGTHTEFKIEDLSENPNSKGTRVSLLLPIISVEPKLTSEF